MKKNKAFLRPKVYALRWLMLTLFGLSSVTNAVLWITYSPISNHVENFYKINAFWVNMLSMVYMAAYIVVGFLASWVIDHVGLRFGITTGTIMTLAGAWIRVAGKYSYWYSMGGQLAAAIGQPFILNAVPKLAANWFGEDQRTLATTIASVINPIGVAIGFIFPPAFVHKPTDLPTMLFYQAILASALSIPVILLFRDKPPTPPSTAASTIRQEKFTSSLVTLAKNYNFWIILIAFSIGLGAFNTLATIMNEILQPYNYSNNETSIIGALVVVLGLVGAGLFGALVDKTRKYKLFLLVSFLGATASMLAFSFFLKPNKFIYLSITSACLGFFTTPVLPLSLELVCEISYPIGEATPTGVLMIAGQISGIALIMGMQQFLNSPSTIIWCSYVTSICLGAGLLCVLLFNGKLKRLEHEKQHKYTINQSYS